MSTPAIDSEWEEKARPGHTVKVTKIDHWYGEERVTYDHTGVHNKRAQRFPTVTETRRFLKRFKPFDR